MECQVNVKSQSELDIGGRETCLLTFFIAKFIPLLPFLGKNKTGLETDVFGGCGLFLQTEEVAGGRC